MLIYDAGTIKARKHVLLIEAKLSMWPLANCSKLGFWKKLRFCPKREGGVFRRVAWEHWVPLFSYPSVSCSLR